MAVVTAGEAVSLLQRLERLAVPSSVFHQLQTLMLWTFLGFSLIDQIWSCSKVIVLQTD